MACEFKDMLCARHHKDKRKTEVTIPSFFNPSLKVHGANKFDHEYSSCDDLSGSENDEAFRFKPLISTNLSVPMLRFSTLAPSSMKYKTRGLCRRYFKRKCNNGKACVFSHSIAAFKAKKKKDKELQKEWERQKEEQRGQRARGRKRGRAGARGRGGVLAISRS
jgi:hypothetical protein